jgi:hypothetical protein
MEPKQIAWNFAVVGCDANDCPRYLGFFDVIEEAAEYRENMKKIGWRRVAVFDAALKEAGRTKPGSLTVAPTEDTAMFADELRKAVQNGDRATICRLIEGIPASHWSYPGSPLHAQARQYSVDIAVHHVSGGSGINTYDTVSVNIRWPDGTMQFGGSHSADELRLPNYIPPAVQPVLKTASPWDGSPPGKGR